MFGDMEKLEEMKEKINSVSPCFCLAKWMHVTIHLMTGHTHSCYLPQTHKIPLEELKDNPSALHNTKYKKEQRKKMLRGERPTECGICWSIEDLPGNQVSDRHMRAVDSWTMPFFDRISKTTGDENINPTYVEVSFSSACNFKCSYCSPHVSTSWKEEVSKLGPYPIAGNLSHQYLPWFEQNGLMPMDEEGNPYIEAFWKWWPDLVKELMFFRITGGEPLLSRQTFKVMEWINANGLPKLELSINSNLGIPDKQFNKFQELLRPMLAEKKVRSFILHTSIDTYGAHAEYIRNGLNFKTFESNLCRYLEENPTAEVAFMCTFNNLSVVGFREFIDWVISLRKRYRNDHRQVLLDIPHLQFPLWQSAKILTPDYHKIMEDHIAYMGSRVADGGGILKAEVIKMERILEWMKSPMEQKELETAQKNFYFFFSEHDRRRGTNFLATFPAMKEFWNHCRILAGAKTEHVRT